MTWGPYDLEQSCMRSGERYHSTGCSRPACALVSIRAFLRRGSTGTQQCGSWKFYLYLMSAYESSIPLFPSTAHVATENSVQYQRFAEADSGLWAQV